MGLFLHMLTVLLVIMMVSLQGWLPLGCLDEERIALLQLKDTLNYPNGTSLPSWIKADAHCCSWERIECSRSTGRVIALHLEETRNEEMGDWYLNTSLFLPFQQLNILELWGNRIAGWVEKKGPSNLTTLFLYNITTYKSSFQLLQSLATFPNLTTLYLSYNDFRGRILGDDLQNLSSLESLYLDRCSLDEHSLQSLRALPSLKNLSLQALSGSVPSGGLCGLNHLQELYMDDNDLSGFLPPCLANLTSLQQLDLSFNHLKIPMSLSPLYNLSKLKYFDGLDNEIYAEEDDHSLSPKFQLESIFLSSHGQGAVAFPKFLYHQFSLQSLALTNIQIKGEFPNWLIENNTYLHDLSLKNCSLSGPFLLPKNSHVNLSFLSISMNYFQGQIPSEIGARLPGLEALFMSDNGFNGSIPFSLGNISSLEVLDLSNNSLQGQIPGWIGNMSSLEFLDLSENNFFGRLPPRFDTSLNLRYVYLSRNELQGPIAMTFYNSSKIFALDLSHNNLTGSIPKWIDRLYNLRFLLLSYNNLEGEIPIQLCRLDQLTLIDLSHNHLSGEIPPEIGNLSMIKVLNLSHNSLTGPIPPTFSNLKEIESLDLSYNKLDGEIPPQLIELFSLEFFSVAHNNLSGKTLARVAQFATFEESCYKDNPFLCGEPLPKICGVAMPPSPTPTSTNNEDDGGFMDMEVFYVTFGVAYIMVMLVIGAVLYINSYWRRAWFHFIEVSINNCYYFLVDNLPILSRF
ncbi:receptor-like protein 15 [Populus nigra]|uniref:receptor-like protein 15 n=1 Tax=Populus nigra TaxID=3691 RepID=UPI002B27B05B|nr:receptor-like protein 15 [Populus nigra]